jgi:hypothetical protein
MIKRLFWLSSSAEGNSDKEDADDNTKKNGNGIALSDQQNLTPKTTTQDQRGTTKADAVAEETPHHLPQQPSPSRVSTDASQTTTTNTTTTLDSGGDANDFITAVTWEEAHFQCCLKRKSLMVTLQQVFDKYPNGCDLQWALPKRDNVLVYHSSSLTDVTTATSFATTPHPLSSDVDAVFQALQQQQGLSTTTTTDSKTLSWLWWGVSSVAKGASNLVLGSMGDEDDDEFNVVASEWSHAADYDENATPTTAPAQPLPTDVVERNVPIVHLDLVRRCLEILQHRLADEIVDPPLLLYRSSEPDPQQPLHQQSQEKMAASSLTTGPKPSCWITWCQTLPTTTGGEDDQLAQGLLSTLNRADSELLLQLLVAMGAARIVPRPNHRTDMVALLGATTNKNKQGKGEVDPTIISIRIALLDLEVAQQALEYQMAQWTLQIQECEARALSFKRKNPNDKRALTELRKRKLLQDQVDSFSAQLLNLEQTKLALGHATHRKMVVQALSDTKDTLSGIRRSNPSYLEQVDELLQETLVDELVDAAATTTTIGGAGGAVDWMNDDELLAELEQLALQDLESDASYNDNSNNKNKLHDDKKDVGHKHGASHSVAIPRKMAVPSS